MADFVAGISRLHLVKAHSVMHPIDAFRAARPGLDLSSLARTSADADVDELIRITLDGKQDGIAVVENGDIVGVVTPRSLLQGVKGKEPGEATAL